MFTPAATVTLHAPTAYIEIRRSEDPKEKKMLNVRSELSPEEEAIVSEVIGCAIAVHKELGPGFKESIYHRAFRLELDSRGIPYASDKPILVRYRNWDIPGQKVDLIVARIVLVELKVVPRLRPVHRHQVQSYLRTTKLPIGLLMNFNVTLLKDGLQRVTPVGPREARLK
jgi:GxxExxY protein